MGVSGYRINQKNGEKYFNEKSVNYDNTVHSENRDIEQTTNLGVPFFVNLSSEAL